MAGALYAPSDADFRRASYGAGGRRAREGLGERDYGKDVA